jgi:nicotinate-nucleotide adenylyltransferase
VTTGRIGVLGGTFDPIHCGHLDAARAAELALGLRSVLVITSNVPPHRPQPAASPFHRFAMVALAVAGFPSWQASDIELRDPSRSYTFATLERLHAGGHSPDALVFVIGADAFAEIESWKRYPEILDAAHFAVVSRPGWPVAALRTRIPALADRMVDPGERDKRSGAPATSLFLIDAPTADVAATTIRERVARGETISGMVPAAVGRHIEQHGLYRSGSAGRLHGKD